MALTGNRTDAEEVIQEAVTRTISAEPRLATERDAHHYVLAAVRSAALRLYERRRRIRLLGDEEAPEIVDPASDPLRTALEVEESARQEALWRKSVESLRGLEPCQREVVELLVLREPPMKLREVSEIQGAPISTVHSRLQSALRQLARDLRRER